MPTPEQIDAILPQTQCGLCGFKGCMPYAQALAEKTATIDLCPPGGVKGLLAIASIVNVDPSPYIADMEQKAKPSLIAQIRETECIGCTKCIQACPVDAILGASKSMHTIITDECTGCELCVAPCPVDCIDMIETDRVIDAEKSLHYRNRYHAREKRLAEETAKQANLHAEKIQTEKSAFIQAALLRAKSKKNSVSS